MSEKTKRQTCLLAMKGVSSILLAVLLAFEKVACNFGVKIVSRCLHVTFQTYTTVPVLFSQTQLQQPTGLL